VLEEVIENYPVADMQASRDVMLSGGTREDPRGLILNVSVPGGEMGEHNPGDAVDSGTVFRFGDNYIKLSIVPAAAPGGMLNSVQIYASDNISGMPPVTLDEGLGNLKTALKEEADE
jgi:hypothetical protein